MKHDVGFLSVATAVPPYAISQREAATAAHRGFAARFPDFERLVKVFDTSMIQKRHLVRPLEWYFEPLGWEDRNAAYLDGATRLFVEAALTALERAGVLASEIDCVVSISSTGIATPSLEARAAAELGFRPDVERVPVFGLGCAGGVAGMAIGAKMARATPGSKVLVVAVELCSVAFRMDKLTKENIVATALFADGAAACVLGAGRDLLARVGISGQHTWPDTLNIMGWDVDNTGLGVIFDRAIPPFAEENLGRAVEGILQRGGVDPASVDRFICHPGGAKVITALERALQIGQGSLDHERAVLADYGNMSAPTALFVLDRAVQAGLPAQSILTAMGPGFTVNCLSLQSAT